MFVLERLKAVTAANGAPSDAAEPEMFTVEMMY